MLEELEPSDHGLSGSYHYNGADFNCFSDRRIGFGDNRHVSV